MSGDAEGTGDWTGVAVGAGVGIGAGLGEPQRLSAITRTRSTTAPAPIAVVRGEIGNGRCAGDGGTGSTTGVFLSTAVSGATGAVAAATTELTVPQSGQAGRFTGS